MVMTFDEHNPVDWSDAALHTISGDLHSKWADKSCSMVAFRNGRFGSIGEVKFIFVRDSIRRCSINFFPF